MRDRRIPDDQYNRKLHIYAETPGLHLVPASEKELNIPTPQQPRAAPSNQAHSSILVNPYARIPAANFVEEEEDDDVGPSGSRSPRGSLSASHPTSPSRTIGMDSVSVVVNGRTVGPGRDPIYAELDHRNSLDDQVDNLGENNTGAGHSTKVSSSASFRTSRDAPVSSPSTSGGQSRTIPISQESKRPAPSPGSSAIAKKLDIVAGASGRTIRTHTRLDASLEIPATQRPKRPGVKTNDDECGIKLIRKVDLNSEGEPETPTTSSSVAESNMNAIVTTTTTTATATTSLQSSGIRLTRVRSLKPDTSGTQQDQIKTETEPHAEMPYDPDLDEGAAIIKNKRRFRRNMIFIIAFLLILLVVVAAVIIALVIVTKAGRVW